MVLLSVRSAELCPLFLSPCMSPSCPAGTDESPADRGRGREVRQRRDVVQTAGFVFVADIY